MKTIIKILIVAVMLTLISCSPDEVSKSNCDCTTYYYRVVPGESGYQWAGVSPSPQLTCDDAMDNIKHTGNDNLFYQVVCK
tara:strand:+ start:84 stop:326 length:243 start_codon:yes stop_codon:yes gene_type:complete